MSYLVFAYLFVGVLYSAYLALQAEAPKHQEPWSVKVVGFAIVVLVYPAFFASRYIKMQRLKGSPASVLGAGSRARASIRRDRSKEKYPS